MKFIILAAAVACLAVASALPSSVFTSYSESEAAELFESWIEKHGKIYSAVEKVERLEKFVDNLIFVARHNQKEALGLETYTVGLNEYADMSAKEFSVRNGFKRAEAANAIRNEVTLNITAASEIDWRNQGAVTPVKNQGQCGSCWSFSATGSLEGVNFLKTGKLVSFSEQELVDCDKKDNGCNGGLMDNAFEFVQAHGDDTEANYPYIAAAKTCNRKHEKEGENIAKCDGHVDVPANDESQLEQALNIQPVSVAIEADQSGFQLYKSGVFSGTCGTQLDHGVLAVGYGTDAGADYWIVKNSWGAGWGESGYIRLAKGVSQQGGQCGIAMAASRPTIN